MHYRVFITVGFAYEYFEVDYQLSGDRMITDDYLLYVGYLQYACRNVQYHKNGWILLKAAAVKSVLHVSPV